MPIQPFLAGQAFQPELIEQMSAALVSACDQLHVIEDRETQVVARAIIDLAERGFRDADSLLEMTLRVFGTNEIR